MTSPLTVRDRAPVVGDVLIDPKYPHLWQKRRVVKWLEEGGSGLSWSYYGKNGAHVERMDDVAKMQNFSYFSRSDNGPLTAEEAR